MSEASDTFGGGCLCGAVRFVATGQPKGVAWCHCESCRKHSGAPVSVFVAYEPPHTPLPRARFAASQASAVVPVTGKIASTPSPMNL
jgi:hypothetical protein